MKTPLPQSIVVTALAAGTLVVACGSGDGDEGSGDSSGGGVGGGGSGGAGCDCEEEQSCVDGSCQDWDCVPEERFCSDQSVRLCAADGLSSEEDERCKEDESCDEGECEPHVCTPDEEYCDAQRVMACADDGLSSSEAEVCENQACVTSGGSVSCQGVCAPTQTQCSGNGVQACDASGAWGEVISCDAPTPHCSNGSCGQPPSCQGLATTCGPAADETCCVSLPVAGGTFYRGTDTNYPATISDFRLDKYAVTVGRFRKFAAAWDSGYRPAAGAGKHTHLSGGAGLTSTAGGNEPGWDTSFANNVDTSDAARGVGSPYATWTSSAGANETFPINYVNWYEAAAFCIWDEGFLPSEAEWEYAAAGGVAERTYPWGNAEPDCTYANYDGCVGTVTMVGSRSPKGDGAWGQSDLAGNVWAWTLDWFASPFGDTCNDCTNAAAGSDRVLRGGNWGLPAAVIAAAFRYDYAPEGSGDGIGIRCARAP